MSTPDPVTVELNKLEKQVDVINKEKKNQKEVAEGFIEGLHQFAANLKRLRADLPAADMVDVVSFEDEFKKMKEENESLKTANGNLKEENRAKTAEIKRLADLAKYWEDKHRQAQGSYDGALKQKKLLEEEMKLELVKAQEHIQQLMKMLDEYTKRSEHYEQEIAHLREIIEQVKVIHAAKQESQVLVFAHPHKQVQEYQTQLKQRELEVATLQAEKQQLDLELKAKVAECQQKEKEHQELNQAVALLREEIERSESFRTIGAFDILDPKTGNYAKRQAMLTKLGHEEDKLCRILGCDKH